MTAIEIVTCAFNEAPTINSSLEGIWRGIEKFPQYGFKLRCVDDGSCDGSYRKMVNFCENKSIKSKFIRHVENKGLVASLKESYRNGVLINCSMVPVSHSLATVTLVSMAATTIITMAIMPGMITFWLRRPGL